MRFPQIVLWETENRLAKLLLPLAEQQHWLLRQPQQLESVLRFLDRGGPNLLIVRVGSDLEREFLVVAQAREHAPQVSILTVLDQDVPQLRLLAWTLGATAVITLGQSRERFVELVVSLIQ